jgi:hypothetical protein
MDAINQVKGLLNNGYSVWVAVAATITVLLKIASQLIRAVDWHDKYFVRKRLTRLKDIRVDATSSRLVRYLDDAIELEMFRIVSGVSASRLKMEYLLQLDEGGRCSRGQLKSLSKFLALQPGSETPVLSVSFLDRVSAWASGISALLTLALGVGYVTELALTGAPLLWPLGLPLFALAVLLGRYLATDCIDYIIVKRTHRHLEFHKKDTASDS